MQMSIPVITWNHDLAFRQEKHLHPVNIVVDIIKDNGRPRAKSEEVIDAADEKQ